MDKLNQAIDDYHALLNDEIAQQSQEQIDDQLRRQGLFFGDRPLCTVLRPRFFTTQSYRFLQRALGPLLSAFDKAYRAALKNPEILAQFMLEPWEEELIQVDPGYYPPNPTSRLDTFFFPESEVLLVTEYNAETPAAPAYNDALAEAFLGLPIMHAFERRYEVRPLPARHHMMHVILDAYERWAGSFKRPLIAILDWHEVPTYSEFVLFEKYFHSQGYECIIADPREVDYRNGGLYAADQRIDLIYKRVLISELYEQGGLKHPVIQAVKDGAVCMVNGFRCKILYKKAALAVLDDDENAHLYSKREIAAIESLVPWTRLVRERHTQYQGKPIDLIPFLQKNKDDFVIKPNDDYGGRGIVLGWQASQGVWEAALLTALQKPTIVQQRIPLPTEAYPSLVGGRVEISERLFDTAPFIWHGEYASSCLTRLSTDPLLNVTAGGGSTLPTFLIEKRA